jgi:putative effector of murein hydrolase LrgA (UPF0299 family)
MTDFMPSRPTRWQTFWARPVTGLFWPVGILLMVTSHLLMLPTAAHVLFVIVGYLLVFSVLARPWGSTPEPVLGRRYMGRWDLLFLPVVIVVIVSLFLPTNSPLAVLGQVLVGLYALVELVWRLADLATRRPER